MKSMKKRFAAGALAAVMAFCTFANATPVSAKSLTAKQYLTKMQKVIDKAKSYEVTQTIKMKGTTDGVTSESTQKSTEKVFLNPIKVKSVQTVTTTGDGSDASQKTVTYIVEDEDKNITAYIDLDGSGYMEMDMTELYDTASELESPMTSAKIVKKSEKVNKVDTVKISAKIKAKDIMSSMEALGISAEDMEAYGIDMSKMSPVKVTVWINKKTYEPVKMVTDMKDFINEFMAILFEAMGMEDVTATYDTYKTTATYKNFNKVKDFKLPNFDE
ncbi:MAG: hypothetical protein J6B28_06985 [Eubacterium sp.]|nr:hypothetical protein [Eubacterium sp.]